MRNKLTIASYIQSKRCSHFYWAINISVFDV